jgi:molybdopterin molybdotransferase
MLSVEDALEIILRPIQQLSGERIPIAQAYGRVLASDVHASHDLPPFNNSGMDGFAISGADLSAPPITLQVVGDVPAGYAYPGSLQPGQAIRIMTGAPVPDGADTVVPVELTDADSGISALPPQVTIQQQVAPNANIRQQGEDVQAGDLILAAGHKLRAADLGILAGLGNSTVEVVRQPRVAVLSTGDELLTPDDTLAPGKIRDMNGYTLPALVERHGAIPLRLGIARDTVEDVRTKLETALEQDVDLVISSAGVSVGAFDVVRHVLNELGHLDMWKVNMRPGKPLTVGSLRGIPFVGLPGNPVSAMVTFMVFVRPAMLKMLGLDATRTTMQATAGEPMFSDGRMTFARVRLEHEAGRTVAYSTGIQSSGAISSLVHADALLIIPAGTKTIEAGEMVDIWPLGPLQ